MMPLGIYISVPFCRSKCSFCNFASGVFSREKMQRYVDRLQYDIEHTESLVSHIGAALERKADSIYLGGGTPSTLSSDQLRQIFNAVRSNFDLQSDSEVTVECAPGTLSSEIIDALVACGVNRVSLGVQSFIDKEAAAVGRLAGVRILLAVDAEVSQQSAGGVVAEAVRLRAEVRGHGRLSRCGYLSLPAARCARASSVMRAMTHG